MKKLFLLLVAVVSFAMSLSAQTMTVKGTVLSAEDDEPLPAATVQPLGGGTGVSTNIDGEFTLLIPTSVKQLRVSYVGFETQVVNVAPELTVKLKSSTNRLDEVVVTGYGSGKKLGSIVGSVAVVNSEAISNTPTTNFVDALQGQVAGLSIFSSTGDPSAMENSIRVRGVNSLNSSLTPLFILDGAPVTQAVFNTLNPSDIESITVLKDAASTSIYGTRAANGVIVITSKKGKFGNNASVTLRASVGFSQRVPQNFTMMNSKQYKEFREKIGSPLDDAALYAVDVLGISTDWMDETFDSNAPMYSFDASVTGGAEKVSYYLGLNHYNQEGIISQSGLRRDVLRVNLDGRITDFFRVGLQTNLGYQKWQTNNESGASGVYTTNPMVFARKAFPYDSPYYYKVDENGQIVYGDRADYLHFSEQITPQFLNTTRSVWANRLTVNASINEQFTPIKGLVIRAVQSVDMYDYRVDNIGFPEYKFDTPMGDRYEWGLPSTTELREGYNQQSFNRYYSFTYNETVEYSHTFNALHNMSIMAGTESILSHSSGFGVFEDNFQDVRFMHLGYGTKPVTTSNLSQSNSSTAMNSIFFTGSYDFDNRYFFNGSFRRDGSSVFTPKHRWANFFSVGAMWNITAEKFMENSKSWLDDLRLRVSYGTTGNSGGLSAYQYFGLVGMGSTTYMGNPIYGVSQQEIEDLTWESVRSFDVGVAFQMFKNRFSGEIEFYNKNTVDMLMVIPYSYTTGYSGGIGNIGSMRNTGLDVKLEGKLYQDKDWLVGLRATFNYNHNEITELFQNRDAYTLPNTGTRYEVGHSAGEFYMVRFAGVDPRDGRQMWYTKEGNLTKQYNEDRDAVMVGKSMFAPISGGFGLDASWKGLSLRADFTWAAKKYMTDNDRYFAENTDFGTSFNQMTTMLNVWTHPGQKTDIPRVGELIQFDTHLLEDASFMRLKALTLRYTLPKNWVRACKLANVNFHFTGRNLWTVTGYTGYDPEPESNVVAFFYPNTRQYEFGVEVTF